MKACLYQLELVYYLRITITSPSGDVAQITLVGVGALGKGSGLDVSADWQGAGQSDGGNVVGESVGTAVIVGVLYKQEISQYNFSRFRIQYKI